MQCTSIIRAFGGTDTESDGSRDQFKCCGSRETKQIKRWPIKYKSEWESSILAFKLKVIVSGPLLVNA